MKGSLPQHFLTCNTTAQGQPSFPILPLSCMTMEPCCQRQIDAEHSALACAIRDAIILSESLSRMVALPFTNLLHSAWGSATRVFSSSYIQNSSVSCATALSSGP